MAEHDCVFDTKGDCPLKPSLPLQGRWDRAQLLSSRRMLGELQVQPWGEKRNLKSTCGIISMRDPCRHDAESRDAAAGTVPSLILSSSVPGQDADLPSYHAR